VLEHPPHSDRPLLVIDDEPDDHFFLKRTLRRLNVELSVHSVYDGGEAVLYFERAIQGVAVLPCLVSLDLKMPRMDGLALLQWLRDRHLLGRMVVAMLSSSDDPKDVTRAMNLGAHGYLKKPANPLALRDLIESAVAFSRRAKPA
jgi:two-component system, response regulator